MQDLLRQGAEWLEEQRTAHMAALVTYARGAATVTIAATVGRTEFQGADAGGMLTEFVSRDFLVAAADLRLSGSAALPAVGDRITEGDGAVHEVMAPGGNEQPWRWSDPYGLAYRIHTKRVQ